jgi:carbohydrate-binding DOMON domain-containing protein
LGLNVQKSYDIVPPNEARTISFKVEPTEAGKYTIKAKVEYWDDKGNKFIETTKKTITVESTEAITPIKTPTESKSTPGFTIFTFLTALIVFAFGRKRLN